MPIIRLRTASLAITEEEFVLTAIFNKEHKEAFYIADIFISGLCLPMSDIWSAEDL